MAYVWMIGGILYFLRWELKVRDFTAGPPELPEYPPVSILIPCYNEGENVRETIKFLLHQNYPNYEIIAVNDGSKDNTLHILKELANQHDKVRVVNLAINQGKAVGLSAAALMANSEYLICRDGDRCLIGSQCRRVDGPPLYQSPQGRRGHPAIPEFATGQLC